jgi:hypothetical protein
LTFGSDGKGRLEIAVRFENVGASVAVSFYEWADIFALGTLYDPSFALKRQAEWCKGNEFPRYPGHSNVAGKVLFPHDPITETMGMALTSDQVAKAVSEPSIPSVPTKIAAVIAGCLVYRAPFDSKDTPNHQTKFMYELASEGGSMPLFVPTGTPPNLSLYLAWVGNSAQ